MFSKKDVAAIAREADSKDGHQLKRVLGPWQLVALGIGCIIGAGIFVMTGTAAAQYTGPALVLSFVLGGIACGFAGFCYAELAAMFPVSGSAYTYAYASMGEIVAWVVGWCLLLEYGIASSTVAVGWSGYFVSFLADFGLVISPIYTEPYGVEVTLADGTITKALFNVPAFVSMLVVTTILLIGIKESSAFNFAIVLVKLVVIVTFIGVGAFYINADNWSPFIPENLGGSTYGWQGILTGAGYIFFAYIGFDAVATAAQEAKNPQKDMAIGILGSLILCTILYILVSGVLTGVVHYSELNVPDPMAVAVDKIGMPWLSFFIKIGAITGLFSVMLVCVYSQIRINYSMSRDGLIPALFSRVHPKFCTPHYNTVLSGLLFALVAGLVPLPDLGHLVSMGTLIAFTIVCVGVWYLRVKHPHLKRPFKCPYVPWVPLGGTLSCLYLVSGLPTETLQNFVLWLALGLGIYFFYGKAHSKVQHGKKARK